VPVAATAAIRALAEAVGRERMNSRELTSSSCRREIPLDVLTDGTQNRFLGVCWEMQNVTDFQLFQLFELVLLFLMAGVAPAVLAAWKGYAWPLWTGLACGILGVLVMVFLPFANNKNASEEVNAATRRTGNRVGAVLSVPTIVCFLYAVASNQTRLREWQASDWRILSDGSAGPASGSPDLKPTP
jgi:hypothetical protein